MNKADKRINTLFGEKLRQLRKTNELTQNELAELLSCSRSSICNFEKGKRRIDPFTIMKLTQIFEIEPNYFYETEDNEELFTFSSDKQQLFMLLLNIDHQVASRALYMLKTLDDLKYVYCPFYRDIQDLQEGYAPYAIPIAYTGADSLDCFIIEVPDDTLSPEFNKGEKLVFRKEDKILDDQTGLFIADEQLLIRKNEEANEKYQLAGIYVSRYQQLERQ